MGLRKKHSGVYGQVLPNPNPKNFEVLEQRQYGNFLYVEIKYPDCTNFEGRKILVYHGLTLMEFMTMTEVDPHFQKSIYSPIARFAPTEQGRLLAKKMCTG